MFQLLHSKFDYLFIYLLKNEFNSCRFRNDIRVVHFAGALKPWQLTYNPQTEQLSGNLGGQHEIQREFLLAWWKVMHERVWPQLSKNNQVSILCLLASCMMCYPYLFSNRLQTKASER